MQIQNKDGERIKTIYDINENKYNNPIIIFDTLKPEINDPDIKIIVAPFNLKELMSLGVNMYSSKVETSKTWSPRQRVKYYLRYSDLPVDLDSKKIIHLPINHILENDVANNRIRLVGRFVNNITNITEWFNY